MGVRNPIQNTRWMAEGEIFFRWNVFGASSYLCMELIDSRCAVALGFVCFIKQLVFPREGVTALDAKSHPRCTAALAWRPGLGELLRSVPQGEGVELGDVLAGGRGDELDHRAVGDGAVAEPQRAFGAGTDALVDAGLGIFLWGAVGRWRTDVWANDAVSGAESGDGGCAGVYGDFWNADTADFPG